MKNLEGRLKYGPYLTIYNKDFIKRSIKNKIVKTTEQEFKDPICEGFRNFLELEKTSDIKPPQEANEEFLEKVKKEKPKVAQIFFEQPVDKIIVKGQMLLNGKSVYQVDYCDIEAEIKRKLRQSNADKYQLPEHWEIPLTTQKYDFREPLQLSEHAMDKPLIIKHSDNLGQNEKINNILQIKTGNSEYNMVIGKLGDFIVNEQMHGKIVHPDCNCLQHHQMKDTKEK
ncbi:uncharacterized protein LOC126738932 [Anthonomus grandis grandis]|uniref:uncharacterized protein LOC126738932 n=1 Tax=Anthonomus grandis grandis TaxID=2921223 RepID=UPI0021659E32|nr:uncharacterized protein LOC126738932 [Anthonomus grandis grandis]XP_050300381.1 uncharacterized protein LOC126738932 [Anthonomus grandis grandis]